MRNVEFIGLGGRRKHADLAEFDGEIIAHPPRLYLKDIMTKHYTLDELKERETNIKARLRDRPLPKGAKRHLKRALVRIQKQIKEMSP